MTPQWEWRAFGDDIGDLGFVLPPGFEAVDETFIVSPDSDTRAAIRGNAIHIDTLEERRGGLEHWRTALGAVFPLCQHDVRDVLRQFPVQVPTLYRPEYSPLDFVTDVASCTDGLRVVGVRSVRRTVPVDDCLVERSTLSVAGRIVQGAAVIGASDEAVRRVVLQARLDRFTSANIVDLLKQVLGFRESAGRIPESVGDFTHAR